MLRILASKRRIVAAMAATALVVSGCTSFQDYVQNGFKVGPNYSPPAGPVAGHWIESGKHPRLDQSDDLSRWWCVFADPTLNQLIAHAYRQNLTVKAAGERIKQAQALLGVAQGGLFPQTQNITGAYTRSQFSTAAAGGLGFPAVASTWNVSANLAWQLDFWGYYRRAIEATGANVDASVAGYDEAVITLLAAVASNYVEIRTDQERIEVLKENLDLENEILFHTGEQLKFGHATRLDLGQAKSTVEQVRAQIPPVVEDMRQANARLCVLLGIPQENLLSCLGIPPEYLLPYLGEDLKRPLESLGPSAYTALSRSTDEGPIPKVPSEVAIGIPCQLLTRRPNVRQAERLAAQQSAEIGVAISAAYPMVSITGDFGWQSDRLGTLFTPAAFEGNIGPSFQWNILNYGRILNNDRAQQASFNALVATYQATVLQAQADVETGLAAFFESQEQTDLQKRSVIAAQDAGKAAKELVPARAVFGANGTTAQVVLLNLVQQQSLLAQAKGNIAQGLIQTYLALGGGWEIRCQPQDNGPLGPLVPPPATISPKNEAGPEEAVPPPPPTEKKAAPAPPQPDESAESN